MNATARKLQPHVATVNVAPSGAGVDILILTEDDFFLMEARKAVKLPNRVWHATSDTQAADMLLSRPCAAALLDAGLLETRLAGVLARLHQQFPDLGIVLTGNAEDSSLAHPFVAEGSAEKFVIKAQVAAHLAGALEAGIDRHLEKRGEAERRAAAAKRRLRVIIGSVLGMAVIGAGAWFAVENRAALENAIQAMEQPSMSAPVAAPQPVDPLADVTDPKLHELLARTNERLQQGRLLEPVRDSAQHYLVSARKLDARHPQVLKAEQALVLQLLNKSDQAAARNDFDTADRWLADAKALDIQGLDLSRQENLLRIGRQIAAQKTAQ